MAINTNFDIENIMFLRLKEYLQTKSRFQPSVFTKAPQQLADNLFPIIVFKETSNVDAIQYRSLDRTQIVNQITDTIEIYTKEKVVNGSKYASKTVMSELKYLVFDFFEKYGATRVACDIVEYNNYEVDRLVIVERYLQNNWNRKID